MTTKKLSVLISPITLIQVCVRGEWNRNVSSVKKRKTIKIIIKDLIFPEECKKYTLAILIYSDTTCTFRIVQLSETAVWLCWKFQSRNLFSREKLSSVYATSIDYARMHKEHTMESVRQIFSIVHTEFLLDDRGDPGLWSERGQSRAKTSAILRLEFLARATQMYRVYQSTLGNIMYLPSWLKYYCFVSEKIYDLKIKL